MFRKPAFQEPPVSCAPQPRRRPASALSLPFLLQGRAQGQSQRGPAWRWAHVGLNDMQNGVSLLGPPLPGVPQA